MERNIRPSLTNTRYATVPFEASPEELQNVYDTFAGLRELPLSYRQMGDYTISGMSNGKFGYFRRAMGSEAGGRSESEDTKHVYHFGSLTRQVFQSGAHRDGLPQASKDFCDAAELIYWRTVDCFSTVFKRLFDEFDHRDSEANLEKHFLDRTAPLNIHLRIIASELPKEEGQDLAEPHYDRSVFTLLIDQTKPGLEINTNGDEETFYPIDQVHGVAQFMTGKGWFKMPCDITSAYYPNILPAYHRVSDQLDPTEKHITNQPIVRESISAFANPFNFDTDPKLNETRPDRYGRVELPEDVLQNR